jgi:hypothetical protein
MLQVLDCLRNVGGVVFRINKMKITKIEVYQADLPLVSTQVLSSKMVCNENQGSWGRWRMLGTILVANHGDQGLFAF